MLANGKGRMAVVAMAVMLSAMPALAENKSAHDHNHAHSHSHDHAHDSQSDIYRGYFEDNQVAPRLLSDWEGDWQSVYPLLQDGSLAPVMAHKAEAGDKSAEEYRASYEIGYKTDVSRITIVGDHVTFFGPDGEVAGDYAPDGHEVLTYEKGNRGVRYVFRKAAGDEAAPGFIQFSDHAIAPNKAGHFHLYWGDDRAALLKEFTNWPTYYPSALTPQEIVSEMLAH